LNYYPLPNFDPGARYNYQVPLVGVSDQDSVQTRLSKSFSVRNQVFGALAYQRTATENPNLFGFRDMTNIPGINTSAGWSHRFATRLFAVLKYDFSRLSTRVTPYFANRKNVSGEAGISGNNQDPLNWGPPSLGFAAGIAGLSDAQQSFTRNQTSAVSTDIFLARNGHNFKFGGDYRRQQFNHLSQQDARGAFTFTGATKVMFTGHKGKILTVAYEKITVSNAAAPCIKLTVSKRTTNSAVGAKFVILTVEAAPIRYRADDVDPTITDGMLIPTGSSAEIRGKDSISKLRMIRQTGVDATVHVHYYR